MDYGSLNKEERELLIQHYKDKAIELRQKISDISENLYEVENRIVQLNFVDALFEQEGKVGYDIQWPLSKKTEYFLSKKGKIATIKEIASLIAEEEGNYTESDIKGLANSLSATLKQKVDKLDTFNRVDLYNEFHYGLVDWFEEDLFGQKYIVKDEYKSAPKEAYIIKRK